MKIGILTFHRALNYGAVLQCYALKKTLQKCNVSVEVIDYRNKFIEKFYSPFYIEKFNIRKIGYMFYSFYSKCKRNIIFKQFRRDYLSLSNRTYNQNNISDADYEYNAIIVGSDQVWNFNLSDRDETYLLDFVNTARRFAYAASFGVSSIPQSWHESFQHELLQYEKISVREKSAINIVNDLIDMDVEQHVDPTLLLERSEWSELAKQVLPIQENYILIYKINSSCCYETAKNLCVDTGLPVYVIKPDKNCPVQFKKIKYASPIDFLSLISNASYVITDSFHGTVFSIQFNKKFLSCLDRTQNNKNARITDLLEYCELENRLIHNAEEVEKIYGEIDYSSVMSMIEIGRRNGLKYLECLFDS